MIISTVNFFRIFLVVFVSYCRDTWTNKYHDFPLRESLSGCVCINVGLSLSTFCLVKSNRLMILDPSGEKTQGERAACSLTVTSVRFPHGDPED